MSSKLSRARPGQHDQRFKIFNAEIPHAKADRHIEEVESFDSEFLCPICDAYSKSGSAKVVSRCGKLSRSPNALWMELFNLQQAMFCVIPAGESGL
jgi:hypothetical protein